LLFVTGEHKDSYDSRYFGFIRRDQVMAKAYPVW
ncbi:MAG: S26 family signal peptidase, partial [Deltaproteobacteria bacterium]|nr:S26 family signal peptidase [Deltaproteobacteria bacterium]